MHTLIQSTIIFQIIHHGMSQMPMPFGMPNLMPGGFPNGMAFPQGMPGPMPMPMPLSMPQPKLPMVVMPYYKNKKTPPRHKKRRRIRKKHSKKYIDSESCSDESIDSSSDVDFRAKSSGRRRQVLTPVVSYVTKDGYVVYQKKIKKDKAKDWLRMGKDRSLEVLDDEDDDLPRDGRRSKRRRGY